MSLLFTGLTVAVGLGRARGTIQSFEIKSGLLSERRTVLVYRPPHCCRRRASVCPVLYLLDGQNVFDAGEAPVSWGVEQTAQRLMHEGRIPPLLMVAVYNSPSRVEEYTGVPHPGYGGGQAKLYARFLAEELKPLIDAHFCTGPLCSVMGSSLGGWLALYLGFRYPDVYDRVAALSPSLWWADGWLSRSLAEWQGPGPARIWLDTGTDEGNTMQVLTNLRRLRGVLLDKGYIPEQSLYYREIPGAGHNEDCWGARVDDVLLALYGHRKPPAQTCSAGEKEPLGRAALRI